MPFPNPKTSTMLLLATVLLCGCAHNPESGAAAGSVKAAAPGRIEPGAFEVAVSDVSLSSEPKLWSAALRGDEVMGLIRLDSQYDLLRGDWNQAQARSDFTGPVAGQRLSQQISATLPLPATADLELQWNTQDELHWGQTHSGMRRDVARARWVLGDYALEVSSADTRPLADAAPDPATTCPINARLERLRPASGLGGSTLSLNGRRCERGSSEVSVAANVVSLEASWNKLDGSAGGLGVPGLGAISISGVSPEPAIPDADELSSNGGSVELGARQALEFGAWRFNGELAASPVSSTSAGASNGAAWASRTSLSRRLWNTPVTASWQQHNAALWSLGTNPQSGRETAIAMDLSSHLRPLFGSGFGASLSYRRLDDTRGTQLDDQQLQMGVKLDW